MKKEQKQVSDALNAYNDMASGTTKAINLNFYMAVGCACKKPKPRKMTTIVTTTVSSYPNAPEVKPVKRKVIELVCMGCGNKIFPKKPVNKNGWSKINIQK